jgi:ribosomal protein S27AE
MVGNNYRTTERECHICEDGTFMKNGSRLVCDTCSYAPTFESRPTQQSEWEAHRRQVDGRANGDIDGRPRLYGGYKDAYWADGDAGEYEYDAIDGFVF